VTSSFERSFAMPRVELPAVAFAFEGVEEAVPRQVPIEIPLNVMYGARPYAVMMVTPEHLEDFAVGFTVTEGIVSDVSEIEGVELREASAGGGADLETREARPGVGAELETTAVQAVVTLSKSASRHPLRERTLSGRTGCGLCGVASLSDVPKANVVERARVEVSLEAVRRALRVLEAAQPLNLSTRAVHAAAWCSKAGALELVREDVGRHCALDKLVGARLRAGLSADDGFLLLTSRCSYELVDKAAVYGARTIVSISAPTSYAVERAQLHDITLLAVARHDGVLAFHGAERVRRV